MILDPLVQCPPDLLSHSSTAEVSIERVKCFKLVGIYLSDDLNLQAHVDVSYETSLPQNLKEI